MMKFHITNCGGLRWPQFTHQRATWIGLLSLVSISILTPNVAFAETVYWGGVGFSGQWSERDNRYPNTSKLLCLANGPCPEKNLGKIARERFAKKNFPHFKFDFTGVPADQPEAMVGVVVISNETLNVIKEDQKYLHTFRIFANFFLYEVGSGKIIRSIPIIVRYTDTLDQPANEQVVFKTFQHLALGDNPAINGLIDRVFSLVREVKTSLLPGKYVQITEFDFSPEALKTFMPKKPSSFGANFAQFFEGELAGRTGAHIIPSAADKSVVAGRIKATFEDGSRELMVPDAAVKVSVLVRMAKLFEKIKGPQRTVCHAVALTLNGRDEIETISKLKFAIFADSCGVTDLTKKFDPNYYFSRSLYSLLQNIAIQIGSKAPDLEWIKRNAKKNDGKDVSAELVKLRKQAFSLDF